MTNYTYRCCGKCKQEFTTDHSPQDYRQATGKSVSCCGTPMQLVIKRDENAETKVSA